MAKKSKKDQKTVDQKAASGLASIWAEHINEGRQIDRQNERQETRELDALAEKDAYKMGQEIGSEPIDPNTSPENLRDYIEHHFEKIKEENPELKAIEENSPEHAAEKEAELREQFEQVVTEYAQEEGVDTETLRSAGLQPNERENEGPEPPENALDAPESEFEKDDDQPEQDREADDLEHDDQERETEEPEHQEPENGAGGGEHAGRSLLDKRLEEEGRELDNQPENQPENDNQDKEADDSEKSRSLLDVRQEQMAAAALPELDDMEY